MSIRLKTSTRVKLSRWVDINSTHHVNFAIGFGLGYLPFIGVELIEPDQVPELSESSPRELDPYLVSWPAGYKGFSFQLRPGCRLQPYPGEELELLEAPVALKEDNRVTGWSVKAQLVRMLYPLEGNIRTQNSDEGGVIQFAMWNPTEHQEAPARYTDYEAEAPIEFFLFTDLVQVNSQIYFNGQDHRIISVEPRYAGPRVTFGLRTQSRGLPSD